MVPNGSILLSSQRACTSSKNRDAEAEQITDYFPLATYVWLPDKCPTFQLIWIIFPKEIMLVCKYDEKSALHDLREIKKGKVSRQ